jgi:hypothetical protein
MGRTIENSRTVSANWPASVASPARGVSYFSSRLVTSAEPIISTVERGNAFSQEQGAAPPELADQARVRSRRMAEIALDYSRVVTALF